MLKSQMGGGGGGGGMFAKTVKAEIMNIIVDVFFFFLFSF